MTLAAFIAASYKIIPGIVRLSNLAGQVRTFDFTIDGILSQQAAFKRPDILQPVDRIGAFAVKDLSYEIGGRVILDKINLQIRAGEFIGISGGSGSGKSTLLNLVTGFLKPAGGETLINGNGIGDNMRYAYQSRMAYVKQQPYLLHDTVVSNICMGLPINWDRLNELMKVCGIKGYEDFQSETAGSLIAENGRNISGGERQRICFARALYKDSDLLVLDEAFSELDQRAEHQLLNHCRQIAKSGKLVVMVTHNQQSLTFCDRTYNIDQMNQLEEN